MGSVVYCIHHREGCKWMDELRKLKAHLNTCKYDAIPCVNHCPALIPRVLMEDHLKYTCSKRRAKCEFCGKEFLGEMLEVNDVHLWIICKSCWRIPSLNCLQIYIYCVLLTRVMLGAVSSNLFTARINVVPSCNGGFSATIAYLSVRNDFRLVAIASRNLSLRRCR